MLGHQASGQGHQVQAFLWRHPRGRFVHQQECRVAGQGDGQLQAFDIAIGQFMAGPLGLRFQAYLRQQAQSIHLTVYCRTPPQLEHTAIMR